jgi:hypothetical protein
MISLSELIEKSQTTTSLTALILFFIKDSMILKEGVGIYLKHLIPFFSRIVHYEHEEYLKIKESVLVDILHKVENHQSKLKELHTQLIEKLTKDEDIPIYISLEELRENLESEISVNLFDIIFNDKTSLDLTSQTRVQSNYSIRMYIDAIKNLEKRVYANYNSTVVLYLKSLSSLQSKKETLPFSEPILE